jgi:hypothetical protein
MSGLYKPQEVTRRTSAAAIRSVTVDAAEEAPTLWREL